MLGFTIDSITLFLSWEKLTDFDFPKFEKLVNAKTRRGTYDDWKEGYYKTFRIKFHKNGGIYIMGSISNYDSGYASILHYKNLRSAIDKLGNKLGLELHSARLYRIDLALNVKTDNPISQYTHRLFTDLSHFKRLEQADGVRFETNKIKIAIYNKTQELFDKRNKVVDSDILRIELRILKGVSEVLGIKEIEIQDLYNPLNYIKLVSIFQKYYQNIKKQTIIKELNDNEKITPSIFSNILKKNSIENTFGSEKDAYRQIEQWDVEGKFKNANDKSRCKKLISDLTNNRAISIPHPLVEEIDQKVKKEFEKEIEMVEVK